MTSSFSLEPANLSPFEKVYVGYELNQHPGAARQHLGLASDVFHFNLSNLLKATSQDQSPIAMDSEPAGDDDELVS